MRGVYEITWDNWPVGLFETIKTDDKYYQEGFMNFNDTYEGKRFYELVISLDDKDEVKNIAKGIKIDMKCGGWGSRALVVSFAGDRLLVRMLGDY